MAKKSKIVGDELALTAKAIRRAEKLERTLTKLVVLRAPGGAAEAFLKSVQKGLERLRRDEGAEASETARTTGQATSDLAGPAPAENPSKPRSRRRAQKPVIAELQAEIDRA
ncbi:hypothetical protein [Microvirga sp. VF16]|uniref:hypothetical protein n=1 Tax=Microvirga sp. VF16 TaxID=2807101 RepID=UPI00193DEC98|nr:hypothetical protein [Microvirga sp. VF16]QRM32720.1 hypothetical protein JO965_32140 [Microvirga sp. VF16]